MTGYKLDMHTHTVSSGHAYSTVTENAAAAAAKGLEIIGMTDHAPNMPGSCGKLHFLNLRILPDYINGVRVYKGVELNIMNREGEVDLPESIIDNLEIVIASLHPPCIRFEDDRELFTDALINTMRRGFVNIIGHPTDPRYPIDIKRVVTAARDYGVLLELNNASFNGKSSRSGGEAVTIELLKECVRQAMPIILGSDAHYHTLVGDFSNTESLLRAADVPKELIINYDTDAFKRFIDRK